MSWVLVTCIFLLISILLIYFISTCSLLIVWKSIFESKMQFYFLRCCSKSKISFEVVISKKGKLFNKNFFLPTNWTKSFILLLLGSYIILEHLILWEYLWVLLPTIDLFIPGRLKAIFYIFLVVVRYGDVLLSNGYLLVTLFGREAFLKSKKTHVNTLQTDICSFQFIWTDYYIQICPFLKMMGNSLFLACQFLGRQMRTFMKLAT
jgi:hypothetical protein